MGRKALTTAPALVDDAPLDAAELLASQNLMGAVAQDMNAERDLVNQLLGQAQMAGAFEEFSRTVRTSKLAFVKENKLYRALAGRKSPHGAETLSGTWEEFCTLLDRSVDQVDRDIANLRAFGEEALESMSKMGIGYRELRQYRRLPEDDKSALVEAARSGDKDSFIELAEEIISKHAKEKADLNKRLDEVNADYDAQGEVLAKKSSDLNTTTVELLQARKRIATLPAEQALKELRMEVVAITTASESEIQVNLRAGFGQLLQHGEASGQDPRPFMALQLRQIEIAIARIRMDFDLEADDAEAVPAWLGEDAPLPADVVGA